MTLSSALSFVFVSSLASSASSTWMAGLADWTGRLLGHEGRDWLLAFFIVFLIPVLAIVVSLPRSITQSKSFALFYPMSAFVAVPACFWYQRTPQGVQDLLLVLTTAAMLGAIVMQAIERLPTRRWSLMVQVFSYFGLFLFLYDSYLNTPILISVPLFALATCVIWASDAPIRLTVSRV